MKNKSLYKNVKIHLRHSTNLISRVQFFLKRRKDELNFGTEFLKIRTLMGGIEFIFK